MEDVGVFDIASLNLTGAEQSSLKLFVESWESHSWPVLFAGAGFSKYSSKPKPEADPNSKFGSWEDLLNDIRDGLANGDDKVREKLATDPLRLAQIFEKHAGRAALIDLVFKHVPSDQYLPGDAHEKLRALRWGAIVTTNYDDLIERAYQHRRTVRRVIHDEDLTQYRSLADLLVVKLHGDLIDRKSIVLTEEDYRRYPATRPGISVKVRQLLTEHPVLFVGFSLTDPHFTMIDGWIRDTVSKLRLPAIAIMHSDAVPAERSMWQDRGVTTVTLGHSFRLEHLFTALETEQMKRLQARPANRYVVQKLEGEAREIAMGEGPERVEKLVTKLRGILSHAGQRENRNAAVLNEIRWFAYGWHNVFGRFPRDGNEAKPNDLTSGDVYEPLTSGEKRDLLLLALEAGVETVVLSKNTRLDVLETLTSTAFSLTGDELARAYLSKARIRRDAADTAVARELVERARQSGVAPSLQTAIAEEKREILFQEGDAKCIGEELQRPLEQAIDVFAMCRRGADHLVLGQPDRAQGWYTQALQQAKTGDEQYAALRGVLACTYRPFGAEHDQAARLREDALHHEFRSIPENERKRTRDALALIDMAGEVLLDDGYKESAIQNLLSFLNEARHMGWPHSPEHNVSHVIETAAKRAARLLCRLGASEREDGDGAREGVPLLIRYGIADEAKKTFTREVVERLAASPSDVAWFRTLAKLRPTLPRSADAHLTSTLRGIPLLRDAEITNVVSIVVSHFDNWLQDRSADLDVLPTCFELLRDAESHLPRDSVRAVIDMTTRSLGSSRAMFRLEPRFSFHFWRQAGFVTAGDESTLALGDELARAVANAATDVHWLRGLTTVTVHAARAELFDEPQRKAVMASFERLLAAAVKDTKADTYKMITYTEALEALDTQQDKPSLQPFAGRAVESLERDRRSSMLGRVMSVTASAFSHLSAPEKAAVFAFATNYAQALIDGKADSEHVPSLSELFEVLAKHFPRRRKTLLPLLLGLARRSTAALRALSRVGGEDVTPATVDLARRALVIERPQTDALLWISWWLDAQPRGDVSPVIDIVRGVAASEVRDARRNALRALSSYARVNGMDDNVFGIVHTLAENDPSYIVRCHALDTLRLRALTPAQAAACQSLAVRAAQSDIALERRMAPLLAAHATAKHRSHSSKPRRTKRK